MAGDSRVIWRANTQIFICSHLSWGLAKAGAKWPGDDWGKNGDGNIEEWTERVVTGIQCWANIHMQQPSSSGRPLPSEQQQPEWKQYPRDIARDSKFARDSKSLEVSKGLLKVRQGQHLTSLEVDPERKKTTANTRVYPDESHCDLLHDLWYFLSCIAF